MRANPLLCQLVKFGLVGLSNTLLSLVAFRVLIASGVGATEASGLGFVVGAVNGYCWNRRWTFAAADTMRSRLRYLLVQLGGLGLTSALVWSFDRARLAATLSYLIAIACVTLATFTVNRRFTFRPSADDAPRGLVGDAAAERLPSTRRSRPQALPNPRPELAQIAAAPCCQSTTHGGEVMHVKRIKRLQTVAAVVAAAAVASGAALAATHSNSTTTKMTTSTLPSSTTKPPSGTPPSGNAPSGLPGGAMTADYQAAATYLGTTAKKLESELRTGKTTLAKIAARTSGRSVNGLIAAVVAAEKRRVLAGVKAGKITAKQEKQMLAGLTKQVTAFVNGKVPGGAPPSGTPPTTTPTTSG